MTAGEAFEAVAVLRYMEEAKRRTLVAFRRKTEAHYQAEVPRLEREVAALGLAIRALQGNTDTARPLTDERQE